MFASVLVDALSSRSAVHSAAVSYLQDRLTEELGIEVGKGEPADIARVVDRMVADLPAPPRALKVVRRSHLGASGRVPEDTSVSSGSTRSGIDIGMDNSGAHASRASASVDESASTDGGDPDRGPYALRLRHLVHEVRVFAACNVALFLLTGLLAMGRRPAAVPCLMPAGLLGIATLASIVIYIGARDWFWSFLDDAYAGIGYLSLVGVILAFLMDIVLNRARVTGLLLRVVYWVPV